MTEFKDHPSIKFDVCQFRALANNIKKKIQLLTSKVVNEKFAYSNDDDTIFVVYSADKLIGYAMLASRSPGARFPNEDDSVYLYNFITDPQYQNIKCSVSLMLHIKKYVAATAKFINIDIIEGSNKAEKFFVRNDFKFIREHKTSRKKMRMFTCSLELPSVGVETA